MDEIMIGRLADANDREFSSFGFGGMYAPIEDDDKDDWRGWAEDHKFDSYYEEEE